MHWRRVFEVASREPHSKILVAARLGVSFDHDAAAAANGSTNQSVSRPLRELEEVELIRRRREERRDQFILTSLGESVRATLLGGPPLLAGSWFLTIRHGDADPAAVRALLSERDGISVQACAGGSDFLVLHRDASGDEASADLAYALRQAAAEVRRHCLTRHVA